MRFGVAPGTESERQALLDLLGDPDQGLKLREGIQERLKHSLERVQKGERGIPAEEAARDAGVKRVVYASSSSIYGDSPELPKHEKMTPAPRSPYAVSKLAGELYCQVFYQVYGLETVILRYFNVFGQDPNSQYSGVVAKFITSLLEGKQVTIFGDGEQSRDFTYVENVTEANLLAAKADGVSGGVFNIACGDRLSINELARLLAEIVGADPQFEPRYAAPRPGDVLHSQADISRARELLGYEAKVDTREGFECTLEWYKLKLG